MYYSQLLGKTNKMKPADADSANARLLIQGGFISQVAAGIYTYLPLGLRVLNKIKTVVREEMNALGANEVEMPILHPKALYEATGRWDKIDVMFKLEDQGGKEYALSSTAEEVVTGLVKEQVNSYKDFPLSVYQIRDKFRNEKRAKSGLLRGREFSMKDLYSFHLDQESFDDFYKKATQAYLNVYTRCGLDAKVTLADGGVFTDKNSHEFQVETEAGEDWLYTNKKTGEVLNKEVVPEADWENTEVYEITRAIEVGNIFPLECRFSHALDWKMQGADGKMHDVIMGCYGIGPSRVMGSIVEVHNDENGITWPENIAPFAVHIVPIDFENADQKRVAEELYQKLTTVGVEVLLDDRDKRPGEKFADADLIGCPWRITVGRGAADGVVELKARKEADAKEVTIEECLNTLT